jgi:hypothetical protein
MSQRFTASDSSFDIDRDGGVNSKTGLFQIMASTFQSQLSQSGSVALTDLQYTVR